MSEELSAGVVGLNPSDKDYVMSMPYIRPTAGKIVPREAPNKKRRQITQDDIPSLVPPKVTDDVVETAYDPCVSNVEMKVAVLERLAVITESSISGVLMEIRDDIKAYSEAG